MVNRLDQRSTAANKKNPRLIAISLRLASLQSPSLILHLCLPSMSIYIFPSRWRRSISRSVACQTMLESMKPSTSIAKRPHTCKLLRNCTRLKSRGSFLPSEAESCERTSEANAVVRASLFSPTRRLHALNERTATSDAVVQRCIRTDPLDSTPSVEIHNKESMRNGRCRE